MAITICPRCRNHDDSQLKNLRKRAEYGISLGVQLGKPTPANADLLEHVLDEQERRAEIAASWRYGLTSR